MNADLTTEGTASNDVESGDPADSIRLAFRDCRSEISERIASARQTSEQEVMAIGDCVNTIVERAKAYVAEIDCQRTRPGRIG